jgi:hypothetical protein
MNRDMLFQFIQKPAVVLRFRFCSCVIDAVAQLGGSQSADHDRNIAGGLPQISDHLGCSEFPSLRRNQNAGIGDEAPD